MAEHRAMNKPSRSFARPLRDLLGKVVGETFTRQGFASAELVTRWTEIVGAEISAHSEPIKVQWPRGPSDSVPARAGTRSARTSAAAAAWERPPGVLVLRVEGPAAIEIQHLAGVICERVNRFLGWRAIERVALRQAPLRRPARRSAERPDTAAATRIAESLSDIADDGLRLALARLGAAVRRN
jgi:hypothetical protein